MSGRSQVGDMFRVSDGWNVESEGIMFGGLNRVATSESALLSILEGTAGGLDILISQVRELGRWDMMRSLRSELVRSFTAMAVDVYSTDKGDFTFNYTLSLLLLTNAHSYQSCCIRIHLIIFSFLPPLFLTSSFSFSFSMSVLSYHTLSLSHPL